MLSQHTRIFSVTLRTGIIGRILLTLAFDIPASIHSLDIQLEDRMGARGAVVLRCLGGGAILIGQRNQAENLTTGGDQIN